MMERSRKLTIPALAMAFALSSFSSVAMAEQDSSGMNGSEASDSSMIGSDAWITTKVRAELATTVGLDSAKVSVETEDGTVILTGVVDNEVMVEKVVAAAKSVEGIKDVDHEGLKVK